MRIIQSVRRRHLLALIGVLILLFIIFSGSGENGDEGRAEAMIEEGIVRETVSVSGFIEAKNTAELSFPTTGIVTDVMVAEGDMVTEGDILATLGSRPLVAQRSEAFAALQKAQAAYDELLAGPSPANRAETDRNLNSAQVALNETITLEAEKVASARTALLSNDLRAYADDPDDNVTAPVISGSYTCEEEGMYTLELYSSGAFSGYSYTLGGLEGGSDAAYTQQQAPLGTCGLTIQFTEGDRYAQTSWTIPVPNTNSPTYTSFKNAYDLAKETQSAALNQAAATLELAEARANRENEDPTSFEAEQALSSIRQAQAAVNAIDAQIAEKSIVAPFDGTITNVDVLPGETAGTVPIITLLAADAFTLTARIPEIDITKIATNQPAEVVFDAQSSETLTGRVFFSSPLATEIDGVAYFETTIELDENPTWLRSGLNADIDIITGEVTDTLRVPLRFIQTDDDDATFVIVKDGETLTEQYVTVEFTGNEGYVAISGLTAGTTVVTPAAE